jgi:hypothetical protein
LTERVCNNSSNGRAEGAAADVDDEEVEDVADEKAMDDEAGFNGEGLRFVAEERASEVTSPL